MDSALRCRTQPGALQTVFWGSTGPSQNLHFKLQASFKTTEECHQLAAESQDTDTPSITTRRRRSAASSSSSSWKRAPTRPTPGLWSCSARKIDSGTGSHGISPAIVTGTCGWGWSAIFAVRRSFNSRAAPALNADSSSLLSSLNTMLTTLPFHLAGSAAQSRRPLNSKITGKDTTARQHANFQKKARIKRCRATVLPDWGNRWHQEPCFPGGCAEVFSVGGGVILQSGQLMSSHAAPAASSRPYISTNRPCVAGAHVSFRAAVIW